MHQTVPRQSPPLGATDQRLLLVLWFGAAPQLYMTVPQVLLPVIPHLTSELHSDEGAKRLEAATLLGRLLSLPGNRLVNEYKDVLDALLRRYSDTQVCAGWL